MSKLQCTRCGSSDVEMLDVFHPAVKEKLAKLDGYGIGTVADVELPISNVKEIKSFKCNKCYNIFDAALLVDNRPDWDQYFMSMVYLVAMRSSDPDTHIGAIIVSDDHRILATGYNGLPHDINITEERTERPEKYFWYEHGERNAIYQAARHGISVDGCTMYTNGVPCADCARAIIQAGVKKVIIDEEWEANSPEKWKEHAIRTRTMLKEAGVELINYSIHSIDLLKPIKYLRGEEI